MNGKKLIRECLKPAYLAVAANASSINNQLIQQQNDEAVRLNNQMIQQQNDMFMNQQMNMGMPGMF